jgi:two-component system response regulator YesN
VEKVKEYIRENYASDLSLDVLSRVACMSRAYFSVLFKREEGQSLTDYITAVRIAKAKELLRQPDARVYDVAFRIGFRDEKYFSRTFKKATGMTARDYKNYL